MRYLKTLGLMALATMAMMVGAGGAAASTLTQAPPFTGTVKAESEEAISMYGVAEIICQKSAMEWSIETHGISAPTGGPLGVFTLKECGKDTVTVFNRGRFDLHATSSGNGTMTWSNAEITVQLHRTIFGFPVTHHCIYKPEKIDVGTFTGSISTGGTATLDLRAPGVSQAATDQACGETGEFRGSYKFTSPDYLVVE
jgi:hypothetical protein